MKYKIMPVTIFRQNCSLIWCDRTKEAVLVDPGGDALWLRQEIAKIRVIVKEIWITHGHLDHVGAARELAAFYDIPIIGPHNNEEQLLAELPKQCQIFKVKKIPPLKPDLWLKDGDILDIGSMSFNVLHCPGHSPGHVIFLNRSAKFILMGDILFHGGIGRTDLPGGNILTLMRSIYQNVMSLGDDITFLPGHGLMSTLGYERQNNPFLNGKYKVLTDEEATCLSI